jgi:drug/metabolite transporter (DMT)-like permease
MLHFPFCFCLQLHYNTSFTFAVQWLMLEAMAWFYIALLATLLYAIVNLIDDNLLGFVYKSPYIATVSAGFYGALPLMSRLFIPAPHIALSLGLLIMAAGFLNLAYYFFYFKGLESDSPSIVIALFALAPATIPLLAHFIVHENLTAIEVVGFVIILVTSFGLSSTDVRHFKFSKALGYVAVSAVFMDAVAIITKYVYQRVPFYPAYLYFSAGMGLAGICFFLLKLDENRHAVRGIAKNLKKLLPVFILAEVAGLAAEFTLNLAISRGPVSLVKVVEATQPVFVLLIALTLYPLAPRYFREAREGNVVKKFVLMTVVIFGLVLISVGAKA